MKKSSSRLEDTKIELPVDSSSTDPDLCARFTSALYHTASRRALHWLRPHLQGIPHSEVWMVTVDGEGTLTSSFCLTKGGLHRLHVAILDVLLRASPLAPAGIILLQNRPGTIYEGTPIDFALSLQVALFCDMHGFPLIDHIYVDTQGYPYFVSERGHLQGIAPLRRAIDERLSDLTQKEDERLRREQEEVERRTGPAAAAATPPREEPPVYRKRNPQKP